MADDSNRWVEFAFFHDGVLLETNSPETGSSSEEVSCTFQKPEQSSDVESAKNIEVGWKIVFNTEYLSDFFLIQSAKRDISESFASLPGKVKCR